MWNFINKHPYWSVLLIVPTVSEALATKVVNPLLAKVGLGKPIPPPATGGKVVL